MFLVKNKQIRPFSLPLLKCGLFFLFLIFGNRKVKAQEGYPLYTEYLSGNPYIAHPSMAGDRLAGFRIKTSLRKQWLGQADAPNQQMMTLEYSASGASKLALMLFSDQNGYHNLTGFYATYAHHISFQDVTWNTKRTFPTKNDQLKELYFGISIGTLQNNLDTTHFDFSSQDPVLDQAMQASSYLNADVGVSFITSKFSVNLTLKNLLSSPLAINENTVSSNGDSAYYRRLLVGLGYTFYNTGNWALEPSLLYQTFELSKEQVFDYNLKLYRYVRQGRIWLGISYRSDLVGAGSSTQNINQKTTLKWMTPLIGLDYKNLLFSYNYANTRGSIRFSTTGIHQVSLGFTF